MAASANGVEQLLAVVTAVVFTDEHQLAAFVLGQFAGEPGVEHKMIELGGIEEAKTADDEVILGKA
ncbi:hypothetical protein D3C81_1111680 [compost metagenome]